MQNDTLVRTSHFLLAGIFVMSGVGKLFDWEALVNSMAALGNAPVVVAAMLGAAAAIEVGGGLLLVPARTARAAAAVLALYLLAVTVGMHPFWRLDDMDRVEQTVHFMKNLAIVGGLLAVAAAAPIRPRGKRARAMEVSEAA